MISCTQGIHEHITGNELDRLHSVAIAPALKSHVIVIVSMLKRVMHQFQSHHERVDAYCRHPNRRHEHHFQTLISIMG